MTIIIKYYLKPQSCTSIHVYLLSQVTDEGDCRVTITLKFDALLDRAYQVNMTNLPSHTKAFINACTQVKK